MYATNINCTVFIHILITLLCLFQNFNYTLDNWHIQANDFPGYMPETGFVGFAEFETRQKKLSSIKYFGQIKRN